MDHQPNLNFPHFEKNSIAKSDMIIRMPQLIEILGISRSTVYLKLDPEHRSFDARMPRPFKLSQRANGWLLSDVLAYVEALSKTKKGTNSSA